MSDHTKLRRVAPRKWALIAAAGLTAAQPMLVPDLFVSTAHAQQTSEAGEAGESGEAGVTLTEGPASFLTRLGYFEGTYRIVASLYQSGERDLARSHLEESHHAFYEDIESQLKDYNAPGFSDQAAAFVGAVNADASDAEIEAALAVVLEAIGNTAEASGATHQDQLMFLRDLMALAAAEYQGGVENGQVEMAIEYRDSWGFFATAQARAETMAASSDPTLSQAGHDVLEYLDDAWTLYPSLTSQTVSGDPSTLAAAAAWIEIIALRLR